MLKDSNAEMKQCNVLQEARLVFAFCWTTVAGTRLFSLLGVIGAEMIHGGNLWTFAKEATMEMRYLLFLDPTKTPVSDNEMSALVISCTVGIFFLDVYWWLFDSCTIMLFCVSCYTACQISNEYLEFLKNYKLSLEQVIQKIKHDRIGTVSYQ